MADTDAPASKHCATTSLLNWSGYVRRRALLNEEPGKGSFNFASAIFIIVDAIFTPPDQLRKAVLTGLLP
jgi:hypothetical protein